MKRRPKVKDEISEITPPGPEDIMPPATESQEIGEILSDSKVAITSTSIEQQLAEMLFYSDPEYPKTVFFAELSDEEKKRWQALSARVLICLDKMNEMVVPTRDLQAERLQDFKQISEIIIAFFKAMDNPKNLHERVPIDELSMRIVDGRKI